MQRHSITSVSPLGIITIVRVNNGLESIVITSIISENIEASHSIRPIAPVDADVVLGPCYLNAAVTSAEILRWPGLLRADAVVVGCDAGVGVVIVAFAGGGDGESAGAQGKEDE